MGNSISTAAVTIDRSGEVHYHPSAKNREFKLRRDVHNHRHLYWSFPVLRGDVAPLPPKVDLAPQFPAIFDQGQLGSCTANATLGAFQYEAMRQKEPDTRNLSRLFQYYNSRANEIPPTPNEDSGASLAVSVECLSKFGVCEEADWPYDITKFTIKPSDALYAKALYHKCTDSRRVLPTHADMKACLRDGFPFVFGIAVYDSMMTVAVGKTGIVPMPILPVIVSPTVTKNGSGIDALPRLELPNGAKTDKLLGGHAIVCVGYDDEKRLYKFRNSWGTDWGDSGYGYLPYDYVGNENLAYDMWSIRLVKSAAEVAPVGVKAEVVIDVAAAASVEEKK